MGIRDGERVQCTLILYHLRLDTIPAISHSCTRTSLLSGPIRSALSAKSTETVGRCSSVNWLKTYLRGSKVCVWDDITRQNLMEKTIVCLSLIVRNVNNQQKIYAGFQHTS